MVRVGKKHKAGFLNKRMKIGRLAYEELRPKQKREVMKTVSHAIINHLSPENVRKHYREVLSQSILHGGDMRYNVEGKMMWVLQRVTENHFFSYFKGMKESDRRLAADSLFTHCIIKTPELRKLLEESTQKAFDLMRPLVEEELAKLGVEFDPKMQFSGKLKQKLRPWAEEIERKRKEERSLGVFRRVEKRDAGKNK